MDSLYLSTIASPLGQLVVAATPERVYMLEFTVEKRLQRHLKLLEQTFKIVEGTSPLTEQLKTELEEYFQGERSVFTVPVQLTGTDFQQAVWKTIQEVPYGSTRSYSDQAQQMNQPLAIRAIANANGQNKLAILVPCHRIIGVDGSLTGYSGGKAAKNYLLELEQGIQQTSLFG